MDHARIAEDLARTLQLDSPPVAIAFVDGPPPGLAGIQKEAPSACTFWRWAERDVFYAPAGAHLNCAVGAMVMGFDLPEATQRELMGLVENMVGCGYLATDEAARIPKVAGQPGGIVYGPLRAFPLAADVVLLWLTPRQAMLFAEAAGTCAWTAPASTPVLGRPACSVLPRALETGTPALSLGCAGMRTFTEVSQDQLLAVVPGGKLEALAADLARTIDANAAMQAFYDQRAAQVPTA